MIKSEMVGIISKLEVSVVPKIASLDLSLESESTMTKKSSISYTLKTRAINRIETARAVAGFQDQEQYLST